MDKKQKAYERICNRLTTLNQMNPRSSLRLNEYQPVLNFEDKKLQGVDQEEFFKNRISIITNYIGVSKFYLDLGCNLGYTSFKIVETGGRVIGVDQEEHLIDFCNNTLKIFYDSDKNNPIFICADVFDYIENCTENFDCVLSLMLFHNVLKFHTKENLIRLINMIADRAPYMIMQTRNQPPVKFITESTKYTKVEMIADGKNPIVALRFPIWVFRR